MVSPRGAAQQLDYQRDGQPGKAELVLARYPAELDALPGPPKVGNQAPPLAGLQPVRPGAGALPGTGTGSPLMLFFWATWCEPCKAAVPQLLAWSERRAVPVLAITDEAPDVVRRFLQERADPFPEQVAADELRLGFGAYGVSATPTFVLIDGAGKVAWRGKGLAAFKEMAGP